MLRKGVTQVPLSEGDGERVAPIFIGRGAPSPPWIIVSTPSRGVSTLSPIVVNAVGARERTLRAHDRRADRTCAATPQAYIFD